MGGVRKQRRRSEGVNRIRQAGIRQLRRGQLRKHVQHIRSEVPRRRGGVLRENRFSSARGIPANRGSQLPVQHERNPPQPPRCDEEDSRELGSRKPTTGAPILTRRTGVSKSARLAKACTRAYAKLPTVSTGESQKRKGNMAMARSWVGVADSSISAHKTKHPERKSRSALEGKRHYHHAREGPRRRKSANLFRAQMWKGLFRPHIRTSDGFVGAERRPTTADASYASGEQDAYRRAGGAQVRVSLRRIRRAHHVSEEQNGWGEMEQKPPPHQRKSQSEGALRTRRNRSV